MGNLHLFDWAIILVYLLAALGVGLWFTRRAGTDIDSFFLSGRQLPWFLSGISLVATSFASDTPLWVTTLIRTHGVHYVWQYWAPAIGAALGVVLFARLWRRIGVLTDIEMIEMRYSGRGAAALRLWSAAATALLFCPLIIGWVTKAMETITREAMGLPPEYRIWTTALIIGVALLYCALAGLWGVVYTDLLQFILAFVGTIVLAWYAVAAVGGLDALVERLQAASDWPGRELHLFPEVGPNPGQMTVWNFIGYFGILWVHVAWSGGFQAQRLLACRDTRQASFSMLTLSTLYYGVICWPWILVALASVLLLPDLGPNVSHDAAYPRMIVTLLPVGMKGLLLVALLSAFMSTISTMLNWGASYMVNDLYRRFLVPVASTHHYVRVGRILTIYMAVTGGVIAFLGTNILQLVFIAFVLWGPLAVVGVMRWFWWGMNGWGELAASVGAYATAALLVFTDVFDGPARLVFGPETQFSSDGNLLGARMVLILIVAVALAVAVSLSTAPTDPERLRAFLLKARPFKAVWRPMLRRLGIDYAPAERPGRTLTSWLVVMISVYALIYGVGNLLIGSAALGVACLIVFVFALAVSVRRINQDFRETEKDSLHPSP